MKSVAVTIAGIQARDLIRSRSILVYAGFFFLLSEGLLRFSGDEAKAVLSLSTASLMIIPLATSCSRPSTSTPRASLPSCFSPSRSAARRCSPVSTPGWRFRRRWESSSASRRRS